MKTPDKAASIEPLESRIAPAGVVTVSASAGGVLTLSFDADSQPSDVIVKATSAATFRVEGTGNTLIHFAGDASDEAFKDFGKLTTHPTVLATGLTGVVVNGSDDHDGVTLIGLKKLTTLAFNGGDGADSLTVTDCVVLSGGTANLTLGAGGDTGSDTVLFNGAVTGINTDLNVSYGDGGGSVTLDATTTTITGNLNVTGGAGSDSFEISSDVTKILKNVTAQGGLDSFVASGTSLSVGKNATDPFHSMTFTGVSEVSLGSDVLGVGSGISFTGTSGADSFSISGNSVKIGVSATAAPGKSINFSGLAGDDTLSVSVNVFTASGGISYDGGADNDTLSLKGGNVIVGGGDTGASIGTASTSVGFIGGSGNDSFVVESNLFQTKGGAIVADGGSGTNSVDITANTVKLGAKLAAANTSSSLDYTGGSGDDSVSIYGLNVVSTGSIVISDDGGVNSLYLGGRAVKFGTDTQERSVAVSTGVGTTGTTDITFEASSFVTTGTVEVDGFATSGSANTVNMYGNKTILGASKNITNGTVGRSLVLNGGAGDDSVNIESYTFIGGSLEIAGGTAGADSLRIFNNSTKVTAASGTSISVSGSGSASQDVEIDARALTLVGALKVLNDAAGTGVTTVSVESRVLTGNALQITGGAADDSVSIFADGAFKADVVSVQLGGGSGGTQSISLGGASDLSGALILGASATSVVSLGSTASGADSLTIKDVNIKAIASMSLGSGASTVTIDNLDTAVAFALNTGAGNDTVNIETLGDYGASNFKAATTTISLGAGDDTIVLGSSTTSTLNIVKAPLGMSVDGGADTDSVSTVGVVGTVNVSDVP